MKRILILGGTTEARQIAEALAPQREYDVMLSLAGRTRDPVSQPVPVRVGGFGGSKGLAAYMREKRVALLIDATHPYAARISANADEAAREAGVLLVALRRPGWTRQDGDRWTEVEHVAAAVAALGTAPRRVFLALGRQEIAPVETAPQHAYLVRSVEPIEPPLAVPYATYLLARGPFREANERRLLQERRIDAILCKNSGGPASYGKIAAARDLGLEVVMLRRPDLPQVPCARSVTELLAMAVHCLDPAEKRGV